MKLELTGALLVAWLAASFAIPNLLHLKSPDRWILFGALSLLGILAAAVVVWWNYRRQTAPVTTAPSIGQDAGDELAGYLHAAEAKLSATKRLANGTRFGSLPVVFILGPQGAAKTTSVMQAGLEPELLAGQVHQGDQIAPTRLANIWFTQGALFVETASAVVSDKHRWSTLLRRLQPGKLSSLVNRRPAAPRAAVVLLDCERLYGATSNGAVPIAREIHTQLRDISQQLGVALPVYVLFTKADRIPFFLDYVRSLQEQETSQLLGGALPLPDPSSKGTYEEEQTARITQAFDALYYSLALKRLDLLGRNGELGNPMAGYEFPRELYKLRDALTRFLLDLCRPSQLSVDPFLRGFYFSGVRPVIVREAVQAPQRPQRPRGNPAAGATAIFFPGQAQLPASTAAPELVTRKIPQWVFLRRFFTEVVLADDIGLAESGVNLKTNRLRWILLAAAGLFCLLLSAGFTVSFCNNRALESEVHGVAAAIATPESSGREIPSHDALRRLDLLREALQKISTYNRTGAPLSYRWGLYAGNDLLPQARAIYFARFRQLLFENTEQKLVANLKSLPDSPAANDSYQDAHNYLKSYLITSSHHEKSTINFLSPELAKYWLAGREVEPSLAALARKQFDFYAGELTFENPYSLQSDSSLVEHTRQYLRRFTGVERVYRNMTTEINNRNPSLNFNRKFPGSAVVVVDDYEASGAFTKMGFTAMTDAIQHADKYFAGEPWVLDDNSAPSGDLAKLREDIRARYVADYITTWRNYLKAAQVVGYTSIPDAAKKLRVNSAPQSPLLGLLCLASENTSTGDSIKNAFAPLHKVVSPDCSTAYIGASNADYMKNLAGLQVSLEQIGAQKPDPADPIVAAASTSANQAKTAVIQLAQSLGIDPDGHLEGQIEQLLEAPVKNTDVLLRGLAPAAINGKGAAFCSDLKPLLAKYPFHPQSTQEASLAELNAFFKPGEGALWKFYDANLSKSLTRSGDPLPGAGFHYNERFLAFFRRAAAFSNAAYANSGDPKIDFSLRAVASDDLQSLRLNMDGMSADFQSGALESHRFTWPGASPLVALSGISKSAGSFNRTYEGLWAAFKFFADANRAPASGVGQYEWEQKFGLTERTLFVVKFDLAMAGAPPIFQKGYLGGLTCVADIASGK